MPFYLYICKRCGNKFDAYAKAGDHSAVCPECGSSDKDRNYMEEMAGVGIITDNIGAGFNISAGVHYENRQDLYNKMRQKGLEPMSGLSVNKVHRPHYLTDQVEQFREKAMQQDANVEVE